MIVRGKSMRRIILFVSLLLVVILFASCDDLATVSCVPTGNTSEQDEIVSDTPSTVTSTKHGEKTGTNMVMEAELKEDLGSSDIFSQSVPSKDVEITNLEIIKRQTIPEDRVDKVWVSTSVASDAVEGDISFIMFYNLYSDGWRFEEAAEYEHSSWEYRPLVGISEESVLEEMPEGAEILKNECDLTARNQKVTYIYKEKYPYCDYVYLKEFEYCFDRNNGCWRYIGDYDAGSYYEPHDLVGTWRGKYSYIRRYYDESFIEEGTCTFIIKDIFETGRIYMERENETLFSVEDGYIYFEYEKGQWSTGGEVTNFRVSNGEIWDCKSEFLMDPSDFEMSHFGIDEFGLYLGGVCFFETARLEKVE